jgi:hypothetical protein
MKIKDSIECVGVGLQSAMTYTYIGSRTYLFELDTTKSFLKKLDFKPYLESICSGKTGTPVWQIGWSSFCDFGFLLDFLLSLSPDAFQPLFLLQNTSDLQIFEFSSFLGFALKLLKPDSSK